MDTTVNLSIILSALGIVIAIAGGAVWMKADTREAKRDAAEAKQSIADVDKKVSDMQPVLERVAGLVVDMANNKDRLDRMDKEHREDLIRLETRIFNMERKA